MSYFERYLSGETKKVYDDIEKLGQDAFLPANYTEVEAVLIETFRRTNVNLKIIYSELQRINYVFYTGGESSFYNPLLKPLPNAEELVEELEQEVKPFGYVPLSLKLFYKIVGACNFAWNYDVDENLYWGNDAWFDSDPIQIFGLDYVLSYVKESEWKKHMIEMLEDPEEIPFLELAADYYHKDNVSGGMPYSLKITESLSVDGLFLFEPHNTTFIDYLRICFENCGFSRMWHTANKKDYKSFFSRTKPQMLKI